MGDKIDYGALPLGRRSAYCDHYAPLLLAPIAREQASMHPRAFYGVDHWSAYEISWLNSHGKPQVACGIFSYDALSPCIVESKSLKLYLNSLNQSVFKSADEVQKIIAADLSKCVQATADVELFSVNEIKFQTQIWDDPCIDDLDVAITEYMPQAGLLRAVSSQRKNESLVSHLLRSNCPVTGQPDWASVRITYEGEAIEHESLLRYICSFRLHQGFHEQCVEQIFFDITQVCKPELLSVEGRFTRRGGLDINPFRTSDMKIKPTNARLIRQ